MINVVFDDNNLEKKLRSFMSEGDVVSKVVSKVVDKTYNVAVELTPTDRWYPRYFFPERKSHELGYLKKHWHKGKVKRVGGFYEAEVYNDSYFAAAVNYGHRAIPGQYIPPLPGRVGVNWVEGIFLTDKIEDAMTTTYANEFSNEYGAYLERHFS